jgi:hypothetical protein
MKKAITTFWNVVGYEYPSEYERVLVLVGGKICIGFHRGGIWYNGKTYGPFDDRPSYWLRIDDYIRERKVERYNIDWTKCRYLVRADCHSQCPHCREGE